MKKEYLVTIMFAMDEPENKWNYCAVYDPIAKAGQRYYGTLEEARGGLNRVLKKFNKAHTYDNDGYRIETLPVGGGFSADIKPNKSVDDMNRIVKWSIKEREVTEWEIVDRYDERIAETSSCQV